MGFSLWNDASIHHGLSYFDEHLCFYKNGDIHNYHGLAIPMFNRHTNKQHVLACRQVSRCNVPTLAFQIDWLGIGWWKLWWWVIIMALSFKSSLRGSCDKGYIQAFDGWWIHFPYQQFEHESLPTINFDRLDAIHMPK
jgi:hypothetical protein